MQGKETEIQWFRTDVLDSLSVGGNQFKTSKQHFNYS